MPEDKIIYLKLVNLSVYMTIKNKDKNIYEKRNYFHEDYNKIQILVGTVLKEVSKIMKKQENLH